MRLDAADDRLLATAEVEAVGAGSREDGLLDHQLLSLLEPELGRGRAETFRILLADERRHPEDARCRRAARRQDSATLAKDAYGRKPSCTSTTTSAARSRCNRAIRRPPRERALAVDDGAAGDGQEHPAPQRAPGEAAVLRAALPAVLAGDPLGVEVDQREVGGLAGGDRGRRQLEQRGAGGHPLDEQARARARRAARGRCKARRTPSRGRSCPSAPARRAPPSPRARAARGRWRRSRSCPRAARRSAPGGRPRWRSGGFIFMRVSMRAHILLGQQQVVRR